ncbi:MAG TPA: DNA internalization-related competence protein ComEC/Rec2 [Woeseiaceae bacterium]|nr:DNA internalization-related competence protein ComEC/Rec2 [Woeseiaceae bacterium]
MIKSCSSLLAGVYALHFTSFGSVYGLVAAAALGAGIALLGGGRVAAGWFLAGIALFALHAQHVIALRLPPQFEGDSMLTMVEVADFPRRRGGTVSFAARPVDDPRIPPRIRINWYEAPERPQLGDVWQLEVRLRRPRGTSNPGVFDYEAWLFRERIGATGYVVNGSRNQRLERGAGDPLSRLRQRIVERLESVIADPDTAAVVAAISVGARHGITAEQWLRYAQSGTSHLMAISGLHVGLAATSAWFLAVAVLAVLRHGGNRLKTAWLASLVVAGSYACLSGFAVPARRATLMLLLLVIAFLCSREPRPVAILAAACFLVTLLDPLATLAPGFQLSFAAVLMLLWFAQRSHPAGHASRPGRLADAVVQLATVQVFLLFGLLPLTVTNFGRVSFIAPVVNFVAVPLFSVVTVPFALAGLVLDGPLAVAGDAALGIAATSIELLQWLIDRALTIPGGTATAAKVGAVTGVCLVPALAWTALPRGWPGRHVALLATFALVSDRVEGPPEACVDVRMLDVGQGLAVVLRTRHRTMLYDTGAAYPGGGDMATRVVLPYLSAQGITRLDRLVVSHSDIDHSGGVARILATLDVATILAGEPDALAAGRAAACRRGQAWRWDGVEFRVLHPPGNERFAGNDASCVILVEAGDARLLLTGDIESGVEGMLARTGARGRIHVVTVPHHGSNSSSSRAFVRSVAADNALVSAGYRNRWGLPRRDVVQRWQDAGAAVLVTSRDGAIGVRLCDRAGIVQLSGNRQQSRRLWHEPPGR